MTTSPAGGGVISPTAPRPHGVRAGHPRPVELRLDLATPDTGGLGRGDGRLVALARPRHLLRPWWVGFLGLGQLPRRARGRPLGLLLLDQGAEQPREVVAVHPTFLDRSSLT